ncbi:MULTISPECIES: DUF2956 domain-containing protein [Vibrio]|uniref:DUF2956 domain-containing protein n=1 Tax=Vibrio TaxID=662 RepID=UPI001AF052C2|nr:MULTISPECIES: DUF2956 domain-containing protein [Vibrio]BCN24773.1 membrane protein [Vibrio alfacsensis]CAE6897254.1 hypothetical protein ACOMICROBIO_GDFFDHBD_01297 [Vibrio sp. B1REV9]
MKKNSTPVPSQETQTEAMKIARATQKQGQTKEQTKLIAQGIEKGIAQYKKQQKERNRQADKAKKKQQKEKLRQNEPVTAINEDTSEIPTSKSTLLPWGLLVLSWVGFAAYIMMGK